MRKESRRPKVSSDPLWYKNGVIYQSHVRAFCDSDANGIGDFRGLTSKLDYLQDLGITALWLLPFYPSPLRDDGYDIADYCAINPIYGDLADFRNFLHEAHERGLRVITELVINHTSDQHPWFQRARESKPGSDWRNYYVWSDDPNKYADARIIFKDFETSNWTWDPVADAYFWHRFYSHQPDLNFENLLVHDEVLRALEFWLDLGVDGLRLDAVPYLYEEEGTNCENLPRTHAFLKKLRQHIDTKFPDRMLLAEANQWPEDAVAYFGSGRGDECHMAFHFPLMPRLFMAVRMEDRVPIVDIMEQTPAIPETSQWALFLRNHDELTLEMVTDEERDYMYRVYARDPKARINLGIRRRLAPLLGNDRRRTELLNALLFSLPGTPVLYYGDEIGMGENTYLGDRNGVRTPMQWSSDRNAGFSRANPQALYLPVIVDPEFHYQTVNVEAEQSNAHSLLWWMKRLIALRKQWKAFGQGTLQFLQPENRKVLAYVRRFESECILVVANLSRFVQPVELDLSQFAQTRPVEIFGRTKFPPIGEKPYFLTLSPHSFFWFSLQPRFNGSTATSATGGLADTVPLITLDQDWSTLIDDDLARQQLEAILQDYIPGRRWFGGKGKEIKTVTIHEVIEIPLGSAPPERAFLLLLGFDYVEHDPETYSFPLGFATGAFAEKLNRDFRPLALARLQAQGQEGLLFDALADINFGHTLLKAINTYVTFTGRNGTLAGNPTPILQTILGALPATPDPVIGKAEQSNSALVFGDRLILKLFRRLEVGINPDLEIGRFLTARGFPYSPPVAGSLDYVTAGGERITVGITHGFVPEGKDGWEYTLDALSRYYERVQATAFEPVVDPTIGPSLLQSARAKLPQSVHEMLGTYVEAADLLGDRTAKLHLELASETKNKDFAPEPFSPHYQRSLYQSMRNLFMRNFGLLRQQLHTLPESVQPEAAKVLALEAKINQRFRAIYEQRISAQRIRCHGDYHLGQVLHTGKDFFILDFEGEPARSLSERRIKRSSMRDVAGMLRSFHYAAFAALAQQVDRGIIRPENVGRFDPWARYWSFWVGSAFLSSYLEQIDTTSLLPKDEPALKALLETNLLDKAIYELGYELNNRPRWVKIPLQGIAQLMEG